MTEDPDIGDLLRGHLRGVELALVGANEVAEPCHGLLCHDHDMTSTLAAFHEGEVTLEVLNEEKEEGRYLREVVLKVGGRAVEYGIIRIFLDRFPEGLRSAILSGGRPLGALLNESGLRYHSRPRGFLRIRRNDFQPDFFPAGDSKFLFGRYNELLDQDEIVLARIIEILPTETS
jgi:hypothetical protein